MEEKEKNLVELNQRLINEKLPTLPFKHTRMLSGQLDNEHIVSQKVTNTQ